MAESRFGWRKRLLWAVVAVLPFYGLYLWHFTRPGATGFIQYDQPYYVANGREIFERGNGLAHPNPYDPSSDSPVIYFHWLTWIYGATVSVCGWDPALAPLLLGVAAGLAMALLTILLIERLLPDPRCRVTIFLLAMWGGGVFCLAALLVPNTSTRSLYELLAYDPARGWWFLNWGRNLLYPTEAVYHALVAGVWLSLLNKRDTLGLCLGGLLAATHPFTGLEVLLFLGVWLTSQLLRQRSRLALVRWLACGVLLGLFLGYYMVFLGQFPQHRAMEAVWTNVADEFSLLPVQAFLLACGPVALLAAWRLWREKWPPPSEVILFCGCFFVTFMLEKHEWFLPRARQPIHFSHGYDWIALFFLGLPKLQQLLNFLRERISGWLRAILLLSLWGLAVSDNLIFLVASCRNNFAQPQFLLPSEREVFHWINQHHLTGVLVAPDNRLSYLAATYTCLNPYYGHGANTPQIEKRNHQVQSYVSGGQADWLDPVHFLLLRKESVVPEGIWRPVFQNNEWVLYKKVAGP